MHVVVGGDNPFVNFYVAHEDNQCTICILEVKVSNLQSLLHSQPQNIGTKAMRKIILCRSEP